MDSFLLSSSSARMWLGSVILTGSLLASSLTVSASLPAAKTGTVVNPMSEASTIIPTVTYLNVLRKQLQWTGCPVISNGETTVSNQLDPTPSESVSFAAVSEQAKTTMQTSQETPQVIVNTKNDQVNLETKSKVSRSHIDELVEHAVSLLGAPYLFGGTSRKGFDCSGFTQYVFKGSDISLPRTSSEQCNIGSFVSRDELQTGDLVFFHTYSAGASHVGIYIGGNRFVHASNSGVRITNLDENYYDDRYLQARRVR